MSVTSALFKWTIAIDLPYQIAKNIESWFNKTDQKIAKWSDDYVLVNSINSGGHRLLIQFFTTKTWSRHTKVAHLEVKIYESKINSFHLFPWKLERK